jgi:DtxR family Mn-dependent transcriptional regulator
MITVSKEDYLKAILEAEGEGDAVISARLAQWLSVSPPAVTMALRRLKRDGLVSVKGDGRVQLTAEGRKIARRITVRHHLIERMLHEIFGMEWYKVHDEAERLEHAVSPAFEKRLIEKLGQKDVCPHGNGLGLTSAAERRKRGLCLLGEASAGPAYRVFSVYERDGKLLEFFEQNGIRPGVRLKLRARNYDDTLSLEIGKKLIHLGTSAASKIWVARAQSM